MPSTKGAAKPQHSTIFSTELFTRAYIVIMYAVFPLYLNAEKYINLTEHKAVFFFALTIVFLICLPLLMLIRYDGGAKKLNGGVIHYGPAFEEWALIAYLFITLVATIFSPYPGNLIWGYTQRNDGLMTILLYGGIFFAVSRYYKTKELDFALFAISSMLVSLIGILQYYGLDIFHLFPYESMPGFTPQTIFFRTTLGNVDVVSTYASVAVVLFGLLFVKRESRYRPLYLAAAALSTYLLMIAGAQAGMVGILTAFLLCLPFVMEHHRQVVRMLLLGSACAFMVFVFHLTNEPVLTAKVLQSYWLMFAVLMLALGGIVYFACRGVWARINPAVLRWTGGALIVLLLLGGVAGVEILGSTRTAGTLYDARQILHGNLPDETGSYRGFLWKLCFSLLREQTPVGQLLIGSGPDTFVNRFEVYRSVTVAKFGQFYDKAHNEYLQIIFCQGLLGLLSYLAFLAAALGKALKRAFDDPWVFACGFACVSYLAQAFFSINLPITAPLLWILLGVVYGRYRAAAGGRARV